MRTLRATTAAVVAMLALAACTSSDDPTDPSTTSTPTGTIDEPSSPRPTETPTEPPLPEAATEATEAGARAFITYYWDLINYAQLTGRVKALRTASGPSCAGCNAGIDAIRQVYAADGHITDAAYRPEITELKSLKTRTTDLYAYEVSIGVHHDGHEVVSASGEVEAFAKSTRAYSIYVLWVDERWRLDVMETK